MAASKHTEHWTGTGIGTRTTRESRLPVSQTDICRQDEYRTVESLYVLDHKTSVGVTLRDHYFGDSAKIDELFARVARVATAVALQKQKLPYDLMEMIQGY